MVLLPSPFQLLVLDQAQTAHHKSDRISHILSRLFQNRLDVLAILLAQLIGVSTLHYLLNEQDKLAGVVFFHGLLHETKYELEVAI